MNKGLSIRDKKLQKNLKKCNTIKESQRGLCVFVKFRYATFKRVNGKCQFAGDVIANGLQIENKVYLLDGKYKKVNGKSVRIKKEFDGIPEWANELLIKKYKDLKEK